jgi:hypothetical protein
VGWRQLLDMRAEAAAIAAAERDADPAACPNDGTPLRPGPDGYLFCPFDGWNQRDHHPDPC